MVRDGDEGPEKEICPYVRKHFSVERIKKNKREKILTTFYTQHKYFPQMKAK